MTKQRRRTRPAKKAPRKRFKDEKHFRRWVKKKAEGLGWLVYFTPDMSFTGKGAPDLTMIRDRIIFMELKCGYNKATVEQCEYINTIGDIIEDNPGIPVEVYIYNERDADEIVDVILK